MKLGARVSFDNLEQLEPHFRGVDFPVELALPHQVGDFLAIADRMADVRDFVRDRGIEVLSVHAAQGNLLLDAYERWAKPAMWLAEELGARSVTFHPNQTKLGRLNGQLIAKQHLRELQRGMKTLVAVETFAGRRRVFYPEEIVRLELPMVLDTAHLHDNDQVLRLIEEYHHNIPTVHLSARNDSEQHLPIDSFCLKVVKFLSELDWDGGIVLEYLRVYHGRIRDDLELLRRFLAGERDIEILPPDHEFQNSNTL